MKPKLLDLFCGAVDARKKICYIRPTQYQGGLICQQLSALIVGWKSMRSGQAVKSFVLFDAVSDLQRDCPTREIAESVEHLSLSTEEIRTGGIALKNAVKKHTRKIRCDFTKSIQRFTKSITRHVLLKIPVYGETNTTTNGFKRFNYWAGSV